MKINETILFAILALIPNSSATDQVTEYSEFLELDITNTLEDQIVTFGLRLYSNDYLINEKHLLSLGPVVSSVMWGAVWEVSSAAPAPIHAEDQLMRDWVETVYMNLRYYMESMKDTSKMLQRNNIHLISSFTGPPNAYYATPNQIDRMRKNITLDPEIVNMNYSLRNLDEGDKFQMLISERAADFVKFWIFSLEHLKKEGFTIPAIEISDEPDNKDHSIFISPDDWYQVLKNISEGLKTSSAPCKIVGPATSNPAAARDYIALLADDQQTYDAISAWSFRVWDDGSSLNDLQDQIIDFKKFLRETFPSSWPPKPIVVHLGLRLKKLNFGDYELADDLKSCYKKLYGSVIHKTDFLPNSMSQSPVTGVRLLADIFILYSHEVDTVIYEGLFDHNWSETCVGLLDREQRPKQLYAALSTFIPHLTTDMKAIKKQWNNFNECVITCLQSASKLVFGIANLGTSTCSRSFSLSGVNAELIRKAFVVAYNNGTISLASNHPHEALITETSLDYDVYNDEEEKEKTFVEFDVVIIPQASSTVVFELGLPEEELDVKDVEVEIVIDADVEDSSEDEKQTNHKEEL